MKYIFLFFLYCSPYKCKNQNIQEEKIILCWNIFLFIIILKNDKIEQLQEKRNQVKGKQKKRLQNKTLYVLLEHILKT